MKVIRATGAIKDDALLALIFTIDKRTVVNVGDKLDLSIGGFKGNIVLKEKATKMIGVRDFSRNNGDECLILQGESLRTCVSLKEVKRMIKTLSNLVDAKFTIDDFDVYLWNNDYPVVFIEKVYDEDDILGHFYGFALAPFIPEENDNICKEAVRDA